VWERGSRACSPSPWGCCRSTVWFFGATKGFVDQVNALGACTGEAVRRAGKGELFPVTVVQYSTVLYLLLKVIRYRSVLYYCIVHYSTVMYSLALLGDALVSRTWLPALSCDHSTEECACVCVCASVLEVSQLMVGSQGLCPTPVCQCLCPLPCLLMPDPATVCCLLPPLCLQLAAKTVEFKQQGTQALLLAGVGALPLFANVSVPPVWRLLPPVRAACGQDCGIQAAAEPGRDLDSLQGGTPPEQPVTVQGYSMYPASCLTLICTLHVKGLPPLAVLGIRQETLYRTVLYCTPYCTGLAALVFLNPLPCPGHCRGFRGCERGRQADPRHSSL